jgi:bifunctional enzyme CysN/CysC
MVVQSGTANPTLDAEAAIDAYVAEQSRLDLLRFITCGSVDDGKSTLIGRLLFESKMIFDDQLEELQATSRKMGTQGDDIDFALLVDGLSAEREQGITIDVAYRFFSTDKRKFIVADTPGHEQYTRNMVTGASTADVAIILIDARHGILAQTRRHSFIASLVGIRNVVLAINKMDLYDYSEERFKQIVDEYQEVGDQLDFDTITPIPMSALRGDNVVKRSGRMSWYSGPTLIGYLNTVAIHEDRSDKPFRFPVQWVNRPNLDFRGFSGQVVAGSVQPGDEVRVLPAGEMASVERVVFDQFDLDKARTGRSVTLTLDREVDASRGDVIVAGSAPCEVSDQFQVRLVWMDSDKGFIGRSYRLKLATSEVSATLTDIRHRIDVNSFQREPARRLEMNDIAEVTLSLDRPIAFEPYSECPGLGSLILIDRETNRTVGAGCIDFALRRASNVHRQALTVSREDRARLNGHGGKVMWFTGLSGSGKSTIANALEARLYQMGYRTYILDGDNVRLGLNKDLGFTDADRVENIRRVAEVARLMVDAGLIVMTAFISPFRAERDMARKLFAEGDFIEVHVDTPLEVAEERDAKGLYKKARRGELPNFTGIDSPYEEPVDPELRVRNVDRQLGDIVEEIVARLGFSV